jgi:hypothetical protein
MTDLVWILSRFGQPVRGIEPSYVARSAVLSWQKRMFVEPRRIVFVGKNARVRLRVCAFLTFTPAQ